MLTIRPNATKRPLRVGLIGYGVAGRVFHAPLIAADPEFSIDLIVTADPTRARHAATTYRRAKVVGTPEELFDSADRLDLVVIASPTSSHAGLAAAALDARLGVVIDKPFAVTSADGRDLIAKAENAGLPLQVFQNRRWDGDFRTVRSLVAGGDLGEVHRFESRFEWWKPEVSGSWKDVAASTSGAGMAYDLGSHLIDQAMTLFGPVAEFSGELDRRRPGAVNDDDTFIALRHESGVRSHLWMSSLSAVPGPRFRVLGSAATFTKYGLDPQEDMLASGRKPLDPGYGVEAESSWGTVGIQGEMRRVPTAKGDYPRFYRLLADALLRGGPLPVDPQQPLEVLQIIEKLAASTS